MVTTRLTAPSIPYPNAGNHFRPLSIKHLVSWGEVRHHSTRVGVNKHTIWLGKDVLDGLINCIWISKQNLCSVCLLHVPLWMASASLSGISMENSCLFVSLVLRPISIQVH